MLTAMYVLPEVVTAHDGIYMSLIDSPLEGSQIYLPHSAFRNVHIDGKAVFLLVVEHEMLQTAGYAVGLYSLDIGYYHFSCQHRVFTHVFEGTSVERCSGNVHTRSQHDVLTPEGKLLADTLAIET